MANRELDDFAVVTSFEEHEKQRCHIVELEAEKEALKQDLHSAKKKAETEMDNLKQKHETMRKQYEELKFAYDNLEKEHTTMKEKTISKQQKLGKDEIIVQLHHINNKYYLCLDNFKAMDIDQQNLMIDVINEKLKLTRDDDIQISHCHSCARVCAEIQQRDIFDTKMVNNKNGTMCEISYCLLK